jgi:hypothetical protein
MKIPDSFAWHAFSCCRRMIDVRPGDTVQHPKGRWKVLGVKAWWENYFSDGELAAKGRYRGQATIPNQVDDCPESTQASQAISSADEGTSLSHTSVHAASRLCNRFSRSTAESVFYIPGQLYDGIWNVPI